MSKPDCTLGVGTGDGKLFVHGDYESIKVCQNKLLELERLRYRVAELEGQRDAALEAAAHLAEKYAALKETLDPNSIGFSMAGMIAEAEEKADSLRARIAELEGLLRAYGIQSVRED